MEIRSERQIRKLFDMYHRKLQSILDELNDDLMGIANHKPMRCGLVSCWCHTTERSALPDDIVGEHPD